MQLPCLALKGIWQESGQEEHGIFIDNDEPDLTRAQGGMLASSLESSYTSRKIGHIMSYTGIDMTENDNSIMFYCL